MRHACAVLVLGLFGLGAVASDQGGADRTLFDAPRGMWLATVKGDAPVIVLEERDGWRRVRLEGWTMGPASAPPGAPAQPPAAPAAPETAPSGARVQGVLAPDMRVGGSAGAGLLVLLVRESEVLLTDHRRAGEECTTRVRDKDREIEALRSDLDRALSSTDNFRQAATRNDQIKTRQKAAERERQQLVQQCRARALEIFERAAVQRAISDGSGRFEFQGVVPARYRVVALEAGGERPRSWSFDFLIAGGESKVLDPAADHAAVEADWGLR